ncbi:Cytochrome P450 [Pyrenophora tritici-repentis]|uniref:Cytochrome P450 n=3 Tax=Pyrenophora tritici-repentis TaxID=45151 RepID=A0A2W1HGB7_9PLEO|nr:cytochrome P450 67 [Pyrenophora tritici-repentis Pt-1C-BFP]EDU46786.1 cytochrome P450 67 [Pyrenophora tritici-repentis Pt-1C-BFP]KAI1517254.1 Cytochrome P450 [Pyrenophora tritici-repentis]KAI1670201.1 Cytochrome P450 [Pyrenophora tritici-repentis]KAI1681808.1 Cytochrome P450 [Pyrenophora tritici-repentis]
MSAAVRYAMGGDGCLTWAVAMTAWFLLGLYGSLLTYRIFLHPLNRFRGPMAARISDLWLCTQLGGHDMHRLSERLSKQYGEFVRIGSSTLMLTHPLAVAAIYGPGSPCRKAAMYDFEQPNRGIATRHEPLHAVRRRVWSRGFGDKALRTYEPRVAAYVHMLLGRLADARGEPIDMARLAEAFAFDTMGDLGLGTDFGMLRDSRMHEAVEQLVKGMTIMGLRLPMWLMRLLVDVAQSLVPTEASTGFLTFCYHHLDRFMADPKRGERPSLMAPLLTYYENQDVVERDLSALRNDCRFIIIAGSDTVAATLTFAFFYLAKYPEHATRLRDELLPFRAPDGTFSHQRIFNAPHLNAVINETLRLHPPASTILRETPPQGILVGETFIPGNMTVFSSQYALGRSDAIYPKAADFIPERWHSRPDLIRNSAAYAPFSVGHHSCLGRPLALMEMRLTLAETLSRFEVAFAPGFDPDHFLDDVHDCMSWHIGNLDLTFTPIE